MKKKLSVFIILFAVCLCSFTSLPTYAAVSGGGGASIDDGESTTNYPIMSQNPYGMTIAPNSKITVKFTDYNDSELKAIYTYQISNTSENPCYAIGFLGDNSSSDGIYTRCVLVYSKTRFTVSEQWSSLTYYYKDDGSYTTSVVNSNFNSKSVSYDSNSGLYYSVCGGTASYDFSEWSNNGSGVPLYRKNCISSDVLKYLSQLSDGTFQDSNEDDYIDGSENPPFNQDEAEYVQNLGYLKGLNMYSIQRTDVGDVESNLNNYERFILTVVNGLQNTSYDPELRRIVTYDQKTSTNFDLTEEGTYIRVYSTMTIWNHSMTEKIKSGERRFFDSFDATPLRFQFWHHAFMLVGESDYDEIMSSPAFFLKAGTNQYVRSDVFWFQVVHWNGSNWEYGDYVKMTLNGDGSADSVVVNPDDDEIPGTEDKPGTHEGSGDSDDDGIHNSTEVTDSESFTDFESMLDALKDGIGEFPELVGKVFSFLPSAFITMLAAGLAIIIVLRILGR